MSFPQCIPTVGKDALGNDVNMIINSDGSTKTAGYVDNMSKQPVTPTVTEVTALTKTGSGVFGVGYSVGSDEKMKPTAWLNEGSWVMGESPSSSVRPTSIAYNNGKYLIADGEYLYSSTFTNRSGELVNQSEKLSSQVDCISTGASLSVGSSLSAIGVWVNSGGVEWKHNAVGIPFKVYTGHLSTSFTFPGYAGANPTIQRIDAKPDGDKPPSIWNISDDTAKGYYGLIGAPTLTVSWPKPAA